MHYYAFAERGIITVCNTLIKIASAIILVITIILNFFGNLFGIGDIIPTQPKTTEGTSVTQSISEEVSFTEPITEESTTERITVNPMTRPTSVTAPSATGTTVPTTTRPTTTQETGPRLEQAVQESAVSFGGSGTDSYTGAVAAGDGGFVVCGVTSSTDGSMKNVPDDSWSQSYGYVAKFDKDLNLVWINSVGSEYGAVRIEDVAVLSDSSVVAVGYSSAQDYASDDKFAGSIESFIVRYSADGRLISKKLYGGKALDMFMCVDSLGDGFVVGGKTDSVDGTFADSSESDASKAVLMSFDKNDNILWTRYLAGNYGACIDGISTDAVGNIFVTSVTAASTGGFAAIDGMGSGYLDTAVIKYNSQGELQWSFAVAGSGREDFSAVAADGNGGCVVAGYYELVTTYAPDGTLADIHNCGGIDAVVIRISPDGEKLWQRSVAGFSNDYITDITVVEDGGFAVSGYTSSANRDFALIGNKGETDSFFALITPAGNLADVQGRGGTRKDRSSCVVYGGDGKTFVLGQTTSSDIDFDGMNSHINDTFISLFGDAFTGFVTGYGVTINNS